MVVSEGQGALERPRPVQGTATITWHIDTCFPLPFADGAFSLVVTRYSFHHLARR